MNILEPWNIVFMAGLIVYIGIRHVFGKRTIGRKKKVSRIDGLEKFLLIAMGIAVMLLPILFLFTPLLAFADTPLPVLFPWFGTAIMAASLWLFWRSHSDLGLNWSVSLELDEDHHLVTNGVYRTIRHPMYSSIWLWGIAQGLLLQNWLAGWATFLAFTAMYFLRMPREEKLMCESFGEEYREYMKRTGRVFPRIKSR